MMTSIGQASNRAERRIPAWATGPNSHTVRLWMRILRRRPGGSASWRKRERHEKLTNGARRRRLDFIRERRWRRKWRLTSRSTRRVKEKREKEEEGCAEEECLIREQNLKFRENIAVFLLDDIRRVKNYDFLCRMQDNLRPSGQLCSAIVNFTCGMSILRYFTFYISSHCIIIGICYWVNGIVDVLTCGCWQV